MREIILDTETTGLDPAQGHRIVEIGGVEVFNYIPTGAAFHVHFDPQRDMPDEAFAVHGLSIEFLRGKPFFEHEAERFLAFIGDARLVIHNADFDIRFLNAELARAGHLPLNMERVFDTLSFARRKHPGASNSLDALCLRYRIDNSRRIRHGALLDAEILAEVYAELLEGRQTALALVHAATEERLDAIVMRRAPRPPLRILSTETEIARHAAFCAALGAPAIWLDYAEG